MGIFKCSKSAYILTENIASTIVKIGKRRFWPNVSGSLSVRSKYFLLRLSELEYWTPRDIPKLFLAEENDSLDEFQKWSNLTICVVTRKAIGLVCTLLDYATCMSGHRIASLLQTRTQRPYRMRSGDFVAAISLQ